MNTPVEEIKSRINITDLVASYIKIERAGVNMRGRCPFHNEKTPSFYVSPVRQSFHCFGCDKGGDIFTFVEEIEGVEFREALKILADKAGVTLTNLPRESGELAQLRLVLTAATEYYERALQKEPLAMGYLKERGVSTSSINKFRIGYAPDGWRNLSTALIARGISETTLEKAGLVIRSPKGFYDRFRARIMFPIMDYSGRVIGFTGRVLPGVNKEENSGKYVNSPETALYKKSQVFYAYDLAKNEVRKTNTLILVEGQLDVVMAHQAGTENVVGVSGTALTEEHLDIGGRLADNIVFVLDGDEAGFKASDRGVRMALAKSFHVSVVPLPAREDPASMIKQDESRWRKLVEKHVPFIDYAIETAGADSDKYGKEDKIRQFVYPYISAMSSDLEKDSALLKVADVLLLSPDAVRGDFAKWSMKQSVDSSDTREPTGDSVSKINDYEGTPYGNTLELLIGMIWLESKSPGWCDRPLIEGEITRITDRVVEEIIKEFENRKEDIIYRTESYYSGKKIEEQEVKDLLNRLESEFLKKKLEEGMREIRELEIKGDEEGVNKKLLEVQKLSGALSKVQYKL